MSPQLPLILAVAMLVLVLFGFLAIWVRCYVRVGPNRVLIVSGRKRQLADGSSVGFRIVKGGGTFVFPVVEKAEALSLEPFSIQLPNWKGRTAQGAPVEADCIAQVKIKGDDASILAAAENFLNKNEWEIRDIVRPVIEQHLSALVAGLKGGEIDRDLEACGARLQAAAAQDLSELGFRMLSFSIRKVRT